MHVVCENGSMFVFKWLVQNGFSSLIHQKISLLALVIFQDIVLGGRFERVKTLEASLLEDRFENQSRLLQN
jgi:hypothetical protein